MGFSYVILLGVDTSVLQDMITALYAESDSIRSAVAQASAIAYADIFQNCIPSHRRTWNAVIFPNNP